MYAQPLNSEIVSLKTIVRYNMMLQHGHEEETKEVDQ